MKALFVFLSLGFVCSAFVSPSAPARTPSAGSASDADSLIESALVAERLGRNQEAIEDYKQAIDAAPERSTEIRGALAFQYIWSGELGKANREFQTVRQSDPDDYELWMGQNLVINWMGDHLKAWEAYGRVAGAFPDRGEPWVGIAAAQNWAGRKDLALESLDRARNKDPENRESYRLESSIRTVLRPRAGAFYDWNEDSDDYQVNSLWVEAEVWAHPQLQLVPFYNLVGIRRPAAPDIDESWVGLTAVTRPLTRLGLWGRVSVLIDPGENSDYAPLTARMAGDVTASDRVRFGAGYERMAVVSYRTLPDKITGDVVSVFVETRPDWLSRVRLEGDHARYVGVAGFEENQRWNLVASASRQVWDPARARLGIMGRYLDFEKVQDNGIWTPDEFWVVAGSLEWNWGTRDVWSVNGGVDMGPSRESGGETTLFASWRAGFYYALGSYLVDFNVGHTEGNVETWTGYDRTYMHFGLRKRF
jgi:hypothetical protein